MQSSNGVGALAITQLPLSKCSSIWFVTCLELIGYPRVGSRLLRKNDQVGRIIFAFTSLNSYRLHKKALCLFHENLNTLHENPHFVYLFIFLKLEFYLVKNI